ncbi:DUF305 domain-containing protein [Streptomyces sp. NPDC091879]|uniref:DUF305 domain-containing protein n=1 Tax=Streptomyces sp. NPDC091879 TaxID=3366006 RepID=UPI00381842B0
MQLRRHLLTLRLVCATVMALLVVGCTSQPTAGTSSRTGAPPTTAFSPTDIAWIQLMIPMAERAQALTDLAPSHAASPALEALAADTGTQLHEDQKRLHRLLDLSGVPDSRPHEGHNMPGMVSLPTIERAGTLTGKAFDQLLAEALHAHLAQSAMLCAGERTQGHAGKAQDLAATIARNTTAQTSRLNEVRPAETSSPGGATAG